MDMLNSQHLDPFDTMPYPVVRFHNGRLMLIPMFEFSKEVCLFVCLCV
jgi:hypothetical protein